MPSLSNLSEIPARLSLNRCASLLPIEDEGVIVGVEVNAPVRGEGLRVTRFDTRTAPAAVEWMMNLRDSPRTKQLSLPATLISLMQDAGLLVPRDDLPRAVRYACLLNDHGNRVIRATGAPVSERVGLCLNPALRITPGAASFTALWRQRPAADAPGLAWLTLPGNDVSFAYWLEADDVRTLDALCCGRINIARLDDSRLQRYVQAGILSTPDALAAGARRLAQRRRAQRLHLANEGWVQISSLLPRPLVASLQAYVRPLIEEGHLRFNDAQSRRFFRHSEAMAVWVHQQVESVIQNVVAESIKRSYAFLGSYVGGSDLKPHTDRDQCEYTLSVAIDASPNRQRRHAWPLGLTDRQGETKWACLAPGDALLLKGRELSHFRETLAAGRSATSLFLHFVPAEFHGQLD